METALGNSREVLKRFLINLITDFSTRLCLTGKYDSSTLCVLQPNSFSLNKMAPQTFNSSLKKTDHKSCITKSPRNVLQILQPAVCFFNFIIKLPMQVVNKIRDNTPPCFTSLPIIN